MMVVLVYMQQSIWDPAGESRDLAEDPYDTTTPSDVVRGEKESHDEEKFP